MKLNTQFTGELRVVQTFCMLTCSASLTQIEHLFSCIRGRLLEVNENILETPTLLLEKVNDIL